MVAPIYTIAFSAVFLLAVTLFAVVTVWASIRNDVHTPPPLRSDGTT